MSFLVCVQPSMVIYTIFTPSILVLCVCLGFVFVYEGHFFFGSVYEGHLNPPFCSCRNVVRNFEMAVDKNMTRVMGRVLAPPALKLRTSTGKLQVIKVERERCQWNPNWEFRCGKQAT